MASAPLIMGILNVTPDSFHDGGRYAHLDAAVAQAGRMVDEGADWIDVGGESTRPGAAAVEADEERARIVPVISALRGAFPRLSISVDTSKAAVARAALEAGARGVNDVTALADPGMAPLAAAWGCELMLMHMLGSPRTMQRDPYYEDVLTEVRDFLLARVARAEAAGVTRAHIWVDPGIGFGKTLAHNLALVRGLPVLAATGLPVLLGPSRKSFIGQALDLPVTAERLEGSLAVAAVATWLGVAMLRVHDVQATRRAARMAWALRGEGA
ncbi:MAG: dihydropteroate synthase [Pseudomonadota bacterium]